MGCNHTQTLIKLPVLTEVSGWEAPQSATGTAFCESVSSRAVMEVTTVPYDEYKLHEEADKSHDDESKGCLQADLVELCHKQKRPFTSAEIVDKKDRTQDLQHLR
jgi:hypothetical protein